MVNIVIAIYLSCVNWAFFISCNKIVPNSPKYHPAGTWSPFPASKLKEKEKQVARGSLPAGLHYFVLEITSTKNLTLAFIMSLLALGSHMCPSLLGIWVQTWHIEFVMLCMQGLLCPFAVCKIYMCQLGLISSLGHILSCVITDSLTPDCAVTAPDDSLVEVQHVSSRLWVNRWLTRLMSRLCSGWILMSS